MAKQIINTGHADKGDGDKLRDAFVKVNANFDELYAVVGGAGSYHLGDDVQFIDIDPESGTIVIQSGFDTGMPVYIKGANCADGGIGGNVVIEAGGAPLPNVGTTGNIELAAQQTTIESNNNMWTFRDDGVLELPLGGDIVDSNGETVLGGGSASLGNWTFDADSATVSGETLVVGKNSSETLTQEDPGGVISQTTTNTSQVAIDATSTVITRSVNQVVNDGVTIATQENGAEIVVGNDGTWMKNYAEPEGPNNTIYFKVGTDNGAYLEGKQEDVGGYTFSQVKVANGNVLITTHSTDDKIWTFLPTGTLELPDGANITHGDVRLSLNIDEGTAAYLGTTTDDSTALFMTTTGAQLYSSQSIGIATGIGLGTLEETYTASEIEWGIQRDYDASVIAPDTRPWAGMVSYDAYPLILNYIEPPGVLPTPPNFAPLTKSASDAYTAWQEALAPVDGVSIASGSGTWTFGPTGVLKLNNNSAEIYADPYYGSLRISSAPYNSAPSSHITLGGPTDVVKIEAGPPGVAWTFGSDGKLTLPTDGSIWMDQAVFGNDGNGNLSITSRITDKGIRIFGNGKAWNFNADGTLTLPSTTDLESVIKPSRTDRPLKIGAGTSKYWKFGTDGILTLPSNSYLETTNTDLKVGAQGTVTIRTNAATIESTKAWQFGTDGRTILPTADAPTHSYGVAGDKAGMVVVNSDYIYYCKQDYVDNTTDIWVRMVWTDTNW